MVFVIRLHESTMGVHVSPAWTPFCLPAHPIPLGCPRAPALSAQLHASNLPLSSISHMVIYVFRCCSLTLSHPCLLPQSPKVWSLSLCLFCYLAYRVIITVFLNSIYMRYMEIHALYPYICIKCILFYSWVILHCVHIAQRPYPFICWWTSRLLPWPSCCKQCCSEHWGTRVSFSSGFLAVYAQEWDCWAVWQFCFQFFKQSPHCSPQWLY